VCPRDMCRSACCCELLGIRCTEYLPYIWPVCKCRTEYMPTYMYVCLLRLTLVSIPLHEHIISPPGVGHTGPPLSHSLSLPRFEADGSSTINILVGACM
jgi:hypothetical protein